jgi:hypothetical protein
VLVSAKEKFGYGFYGNDIFLIMIVKKNQNLKMGASTIYCSVPLAF